jgi:hypothetical protein
MDWKSSSPQNVGEDHATSIGKFFITKMMHKTNMLIKQA